METNCRFKITERPGLYFMVFVIFFMTCSFEGKINRIEEKVSSCNCLYSFERIEEKLDFILKSLEISK